MTACLTPTSCLWQVFSTPARWDCLVLKHHFSVLSEISIFRLSDSIIYPFTSDMSFFVFLHFLTFSHIFIHRGSEWLCLLVWVWVCLCICVCMWVCQSTWQCSSGIEQNTTYHLWTSVFFLHVAQAGAVSVCVYVSITETIPVWTSQTQFPVCHSISYQVAVHQAHRYTELHWFTLHWPAVMVKSFNEGLVL